MDVDYLTVSDPYLAEFAKLYNPKLKLKVSVISEVNSLTRALEWAKIIGSEGVLTLSIMINRNFPLLKEIKEKVDCDIELLTNDCCLNECPYRFLHYTECSHASQTHDHLEGYYNDWATIACQNQKCFNPEQVLMSKWIQPSDLDKYIEIGIDYFNSQMKIVLIFSPFTEPSYIPLGIAQLKSYVEKQLSFVKVRNLDLNNVFFNDLIKKEFLKCCKNLYLICTKKGERQNRNIRDIFNVGKLYTFGVTCLRDKESREFYNIATYNNLVKNTSFKLPENKACIKGDTMIE